ncbi:MAG: general secretion pathway protein GspK [Planctomycetes bacterium]|nr:general secretion pathway protein GspK [Planctomycetota bacterium]
MNAKNNRGSVLIVVMWLVTILSITTAAIAYGRRTEIAITRNRMNRKKAYVAGRAGVEFVVAQLHNHGREKSHVPGKEWFSSKKLYERYELKEGEFSVTPTLEITESGEVKAGDDFGLVDEESKFNVNNAPEEVLARLKSVAPEIAKAIVLKRKELQGEKKSTSLVTTLAEARKEKEAEKTSRLNAPFCSLNDLLSVNGITPKMIYGDGGENKGMSAELTACSSGRINVNTAPKEVIQALGIKEEELKKVEQARAQGEGFQTTEKFLEVSGLLTKDAEQDEAKMKKLEEIKKLVDVASSNFNCVSIGQSKDGMRMAIFASLTLDKDKVAVTSWRQVGLQPVAVMPVKNGSD